MLLVAVERAGGPDGAVGQDGDEQVARATTPHLASLNGASRGGWVRYAAHLEQAGADALELNIYYVSSRPGLSGSEVDWHYLAGADVAMMTSALLLRGPDHLRPVETRLRGWMDRHHYETVDQLRGRASQRSVPDPAAFERANYIKTLASHLAPSR